MLGTAFVLTAALAAASTAGTIAQSDAEGADYDATEVTGAIVDWDSDVSQGEDSAAFVRYQIDTDLTFEWSDDQLPFVLDLDEVSHHRLPGTTKTPSLTVGTISGSTAVGSCRIRSRPRRVVTGSSRSAPRCTAPTPTWA